MNETFTKEIPHILRTLRRKRKLSREQLARRLRVSASSIYNMECGKTRVPLSVFFGWLNAAKINSSQLLAQNMFSIQSEQSIAQLLVGLPGAVTGNILRYFRNRLKLSQKDLARALGYSSASMIHHFEKGIREASAEDLFQLIALAQDNLRGIVLGITGDEKLAEGFPTGMTTTLNDWEEYWSVPYISAMRQLMRTSLYAKLRFYKPGMFADALALSVKDEQHGLQVMTKLGVVTWQDDKPLIDPNVRILIPRNVSTTVLNQFKNYWVDATRQHLTGQHSPDGILSVDLIPASPDHFARVIKMIRGLQDEIHNMPLPDTSGVMCLSWMGSFRPLPDPRQ